MARFNVSLILRQGGDSGRLPPLSRAGQRLEGFNRPCAEMEGDLKTSYADTRGIVTRLSRIARQVGRFEEVIWY